MKLSSLRWPGVLIAAARAVVTILPATLDNTNRLEEITYLTVNGGISRWTVGDPPVYDQSGITQICVKIANAHTRQNLQNVRRDSREESDFVSAMRTSIDHCYATNRGLSAVRYNCYMSRQPGGFQMTGNLLSIRYGYDSQISTLGKLQYPKSIDGTYDSWVGNLIFLVDREITLNNVMRYYHDSNNDNRLAFAELPPQYFSDSYVKQLSSLYGSLEKALNEIPIENTDNFCSCVYDDVIHFLTPRINDLQLEAPVYEANTTSVVVFRQQLLDLYSPGHLINVTPPNEVAKTKTARPRGIFSSNDCLGKLNLSCEKNVVCISKIQRELDEACSIVARKGGDCSRLSEGLVVIANLTMSTCDAEVRKRNPENVIQPILS